MRKLAALLLSTALLTQACASAPSPSPPHPPTLAEVNHAVEDEPVTVELRSGEVVREVEGLVMTAESTTWFDGDRARTVPTEEVCRVIRLIRHRAGKGYAWGLLGCAPLALAAGRSPRDPLAALGNLLLTEGLCPFIGMFIAAAAKEPPDRVVYTAPGSCGPVR